MMAIHALILFQLITDFPVIFSVRAPMSNARAITKITSRAKTQVKMLTQSQLARLNSFGGSTTSAAAIRIQGVNTVVSINRAFLINEFGRILRVSNLMSFPKMGFSLQI